MNTDDIVDALDSEISRLRQVRNLFSEQGSASGSALGGTSSPRSQAKKRGRPPGSKNKTASVAIKADAPSRKSLSSEAKERIAAAQRKRWAKHKAAANKAARAATQAASEKAASSRASKSSPKKKLEGAKTSVPKSVKKTSAAKNVSRPAVAAKNLVPAKKSSAVKIAIVAKKAVPASTSMKATGLTRSAIPKTPSRTLDSRLPARKQPPRDPAPTSPADSTSAGQESTAE